MIDYQTIKAAAKENGCRVTDLIALAPQNDPFYVGTNGDIENAEWFARLWERFGYTAGVHLRRVHYQVISQDPPILMPNGKPYENTEGCWQFLGTASKAARYLELVHPAVFVDRRNPDPQIFAVEDVDPSISVEGALGDYDLSLPAFPNLPRYRLYDYEGRQRYLVEIWCEKSTMNDVLVPLCKRRGVNLVTGVGEMSITAVLSLMTRHETAGKAVRVLYVSDFDPGGQSMPLAVSRKIEYFVHKDYPDSDIRLFPVVLTEEQIQDYQLPRTPIKESERRKARFEEGHGAGATELDALEALHPGELGKILDSEVTRYVDEDLEQETSDAQSELFNVLGQTEDTVVDRYRDELEPLEAEYEALCDEFRPRFEGYQERIGDLYRRIANDLQDHMPDLDDYPVPEGAEAVEPNWALYDSGLDYVDQLETYKRFQNGRGDPEGDAAV